MAELASFCLAPDSRAYAWWQAGPWAGKSALLSTLVLRPPVEMRGRVELVSFFITARLASQDTREAFTEVLLGQLAGLTGQELPAVLPEATREAFLLDLLAQAAADCRREGRRLVLVVDGLDEDRGVTTGPDAHSIAGLLPARPSSGMRVIVAGRANPPVPDDVPAWHPLRDPVVFRPLAASPFARDTQQLGRQELKRLLRDAGGRDLLGLLTAARGGLSARDLAELTGTELWDVEEILHTAAGRTFARRASQGVTAGPDIYLLGHEELQAEAVGYLAGQLPGYRDRLRAWADSYRDRGWPGDTPEYLLDGYYQLLTALGDTRSMIGYGLDKNRQERMLLHTGGDMSALAEIRTALDLIAAQEDPDLASALALAYRRDQLTERNTSIPLALPALWAVLGYATRGEALAASITDLGAQAIALAQVARALAQAGQYQRAETVAGSITEPGMQAQAWARVAKALARAGQHQRAEAVARQAETVARSISNLRSRSEALAQVVGALVQTGSARPAEALARSISNPGVRALALAQVAGGLAQSGQHQRAETVAGEAEGTARSIRSSRSRTQALVRAAEALAEAGQYQQAETVARQAETAARAVTNPDSRAQALAQVAGALAQAQQHERAETLAHSITNPDSRAHALARVAEALAQAGQHQQAEAVARQAETAADSITDQDFRERALARVVRALTQTGRHEQAETLAHSITRPDLQAHALVHVAEALAQAGQHQQAEAVAREAEAAARITSPHSQAHVRARVADALGQAGQHQQAEVAARSILHPDTQAQTLARVAEALARAGQHQPAETLARSIADQDSQARAPLK